MRRTELLFRALSTHVTRVMVKSSSFHMCGQSCQTLQPAKPLQARTLEWVAISSRGGSSRPLSGHGMPCQQELALSFCRCVLRGELGGPAWRCARTTHQRVPRRPEGWVLAPQAAAVTEACSNASPAVAWQD